MPDPVEGTFGDTIRVARARRRLTLRQLGDASGNTASYLSDIENDRRVPSEAVIRNLATILNLDADDLLALAGRFGAEADRYLRRNPEAGMLLRRMSARNVSSSVIRRILEEVPELRDDSSG
ncbi:MAG TPA: helix-turn-helix transcriptional regulator [Candidatus Limnocylindrales bacterium]|nr:helix-turn-helix transcriptional regulator [Candidatus Limnocylindrales bacterium]